MYLVNITGPAEQDIWEAAYYIARELQNRIAAERLLNEIDEAVFSLAEMPLRYALVDDEVLALQGMRSFSVQNYLVFYMVREKSNMVMIERFLYGRRDWAAILRGGAKA
jgi:plasmid stabilization system protein ParE